MEPLIGGVHFLFSAILYCLHKLCSNITKVIRKFSHASRALNDSGNPFIHYGQTIFGLTTKDIATKGVNYKRHQLQEVSATKGWVRLG